MAADAGWAHFTASRHTHPGIAMPILDRPGRSVASEPVSGLYERLVTEEAQTPARRLGPNPCRCQSPDAADTHVAVAEHLRRIIERALLAVREEDRLTRQAQLCNAVLEWLRKGQAVESVSPGEALGTRITGLRKSGRAVREASQARRWSNGRVHLPRRGRLCVASGQSSDCDHLASAKADA
jgi:hypothetical protein